MRYSLTLQIAAILAVSISGNSCDLVSHDEVARSLSPDKKYECVVFERNGGATTSFVYWIYLCHSRTNANSHMPGTGSLRIANLYGAVRSTSAYGVNLRWADARTIVIECLETKEVIELLNDVELDGEKFKVIFKKGISDKSAPPGGMLYNIQNSKVNEPALLPPSAKRPQSNQPPKE